MATCCSAGVRACALASSFAVDPLASFKDLGVDFSDVVKMTVFLVGDPEMDGKMDFAGFMKAYTQYFGTKEQPNLPARSAVQISGLAGGPGMLIEIEMVIAKPAE